MPLLVLLLGTLCATPVYSHGTLDQVNTPPWTGGAINIQFPNRVEQTFVPSLPCLLGVDVDILPRGAGDTLTMKIIGNGASILTSISQFVPGGFDGLLHFDIPGSGVAVRPGDTYAIRLQDTGTVAFFWRHDFNTYPQGIAFFAGSLRPNKDLLFRTYGSTTCGAIQPPVSFTKSDFITGNTPTSVATGDFDQDGDLDLAVARQISNTVSILLGNGDGTFGLQTDFATGPAPRWVVTGDFNADGKLDLATANIGSNTVSILLGNGDGSFGTKTDLIVGGSPFSVVTSDFNLDGKFDLGVTHGGFLSILLGNGDGTFFVGSSLSLGVQATEVTTGDFNWDGKPDLVVGSGTTTVLLLLGTGVGTFGPIISLPASASVSVITADFNRDGRLDIATGGGSTISILLGNGDGTFGAATGFPAGSSLQKVTTGDFTGDGKLDLAAANFSGTLTVLVGNGDGTFGPPIDLPALSPLFVATGDFDSDGKLDLALADLLKVSVFTNTTVFAPAGESFARNDFDVGFVPFWVATADLNRDGKLDLATANFIEIPLGNIGDSVTILLGKGDGTFGSRTDLAPGTGSRYLTLDDFNGDGKPDVAVTNVFADTLSVLLGNGDGTFGPQTSFATGSFPFSVAAADFNHDGRLDLAIANDFSGTVSILLGNGDGSFGSKADFLTGLGALSVTVGDFNRDGNLDLAVANISSATVSVLLGNGDGTFGPRTNFNPGVNPTSVTTGDFNADGKVDLVVANQTLPSTISILLGKGDGTFGPKNDFAAGFAPFSVTTGDLNRDGKLDLVTANASDGTVSVLLGNGDGTFGPNTDVAAGNFNSLFSVTMGDFNGDGKVDLATSDAVSNTIAILLNTPSPTNTPAGTNVVVNLVDATTGTTSAALRFSSVTQPGTTTMTISSGGPPPASGFKLGNPPTYFGLTTTAVFSGTVQVCIDYSGISFGNEAALKLFHFEGGVWVDATVSLDTTNKIICADVSSLSAFAILEPEANQPPVADAGPDQTLECTSPSGTPITLDGTASTDPDGDPLIFEWRDAGGSVVGTSAVVNLTLPLGMHTFTLTVDDGQGGTANDSVVVTVRDTTPPTLSFTLAPNVLWPPDHKLDEVTADILVSDICDPDPSIILVSITSNEPDDGLGDGDTANDIQGAGFGTDDRSFFLRAERSGTGTGRIYTVTYQATDASGNTTIATRQVTVPHDQSGP